MQWPVICAGVYHLFIRYVGMTCARGSPGANCRDHHEKCTLVVCDTVYLPLLPLCSAVPLSVDTYVSSLNLWKKKPRGLQTHKKDSVGLPLILLIMISISR